MPLYFMITDIRQVKQVEYQHALLDIQKKNVLPQEIQLVVS